MSEAIVTNPWADFMLTAGVMGLLLMIAFGIGSWLEQGGRSADDDYDDD